MENIETANTLDAKRAFEAIAQILSARENVTITVKSIKRKEKPLSPDSRGEDGGPG